ncbi:hypothetical protein WN55_10961 [Dufourea novaeangliae]|uniref:Uncharacterized protein n=1 Tax=Dufourea novaeangliae TaxID=178035 RepID=A0A154PAH6_DUFNO|nr:hypothetical protein WN55_10961 [Dufourea novaeangliae]
MTVADEPVTSMFQYSGSIELVSSTNDPMPLREAVVAVNAAVLSSSSEMRSVVDRRVARVNDIYQNGVRRGEKRSSNWVSVSSRESRIKKHIRTGLENRERYGRGEETVFTALSDTLVDRVKAAMYNKM